MSCHRWETSLSLYCWCKNWTILVWWISQLNLQLNLQLNFGFCFFSRNEKTPCRWHWELHSLFIASNAQIRRWLIKSYWTSVFLWTEHCYRGSAICVISHEKETFQESSFSWDIGYVNFLWHVNNTETWSGRNFQVPSLRIDMLPLFVKRFTDKNYCCNFFSLFVHGRIRRLNPFLFRPRHSQVLLVLKIHNSHLLEIHLRNSVQTTCLLVSASDGSFLARDSTPVRFFSQMAF